MSRWKKCKPWAALCDIIDFSLTNEQGTVKPRLTSRWNQRTQRRCWVVPSFITWVWVAEAVMSPAATEGVGTNSVILLTSVLTFKYQSVVLDFIHLYFLPPHSINKSVWNCNVLWLSLKPRDGQNLFSRPGVVKLFNSLVTRGSKIWQSGRTRSRRGRWSTSCKLVIVWLVKKMSVDVKN